MDAAALLIQTIASEGPDLRFQPEQATLSEYGLIVSRSEILGDGVHNGRALCGQDSDALNGGDQLFGFQK